MSMAIPLDTSSPEIRLQISLIRLQVLTPLSLLVNVAAAIVTSFGLDPSLAKVSRLHPTSISPSPSMVAIYWLVTFVTQLGYCFLLVVARKQETKELLVYGVGFSLIIVNWIMAGWCVAWALQAFWVSTTLLGIVTVILSLTNLNILARSRYAPTSSRPLDTLCVHTPLRLSLVMPLVLTTWHSLFIAIGHWWEPNREDKFASYQWEGLGVVVAGNIVGLLIVALRSDIVWCAAHFWINVAVFLQRPKSTPVFVSSLVFAILHPIVLVGVSIYSRVRSKPPAPGPIALPEDDFPTDQRYDSQPREITSEDIEAMHGDSRANEHRPPNATGHHQQKDVAEEIWGS